MMNGTMTNTTVEPTNVTAVTEGCSNIDSDNNVLIETKTMSIESVVKHWYKYDCANVY